MRPSKYQDKFVFLREMSPLHYNADVATHQISFVSPLPRGYPELIQNEELLEKIVKGAFTIQKAINNEVSEKNTPFENILHGYWIRTEEQQEELLPGFILSEPLCDNRGVYGIVADGPNHSGDIYLDSNSSNFYDFMTAKAFRDFFEPATAFHCHNVDFYWQGLLTREFCVRYFNMMNQIIVEELGTEAKTIKDRIEELDSK